jgi:cbb3-type cytochrome oxidase maturation protein
VESLYILVPLSVLLVLAILGVFAWALHGGQFDGLDDEGQRILAGDAAPFDQRQHVKAPRTEE